MSVQDLHTSVKQYLAANQDRFLAELFDLLRIPSVSADPKYKPDVLKTAELVATHFSAIDLENVLLIETSGFPAVYAEKILNKDFPTVLVYGHYDVQPPDPLDLWQTPPFEPVIREGKIYARGSCDDKGQFFMHTKAIEILLKLQKLPVNVKFLIEGEEEVGSANLETLLQKYQEKLHCDVILISDTSMIANDSPSLTVGLRGLAYMEVEVIGPNRDLHSGVYGGAVDNPVNVLCEIIASLKDEKGHITIPGFYDDVLNLSTEERNEMAKRPFDKQEYLDHLDIQDTRGEDGYSIIEQTSIRPTLDVNGIWGGYIGEGAKTVLPSKANAKISMRLVPNQSSEKIMKLFTEHIQKIAPPTVKVTITPHHGGEAVVTSTKSTGYLAAEEAMLQSFGKKPIPTREGGSIPIVALFTSILQAPVVLMGFGLDSDAIHSPNEHYGVFNFLKGIETIPLFYAHYAQLTQEKH
ncbi:MAG: dipeptidase [Bacteroidia bacterium]|nr:dipeptidase [Bacteroidia bacterium]